MANRKICLNMIVKNESHIICETFDSVYKFIDYYVIVDTGSTDNTIDVIKSYFHDKNIPGEVVTHDFKTCNCHPGIYKEKSNKYFHFGWNRSYALQMCAGKAEYAFVIDADDLVVGTPDFSDLTKDVYSVIIGTDFRYHRNQLFKNPDPAIWFYDGVLHEYPDCTKKPHTDGTLGGDYHIESRRLGDRTVSQKGISKFEKDAFVFEEELKDQSLTIGLKIRYSFYLAQSYMDAQFYDKAIEWYYKRIALNGFPDEVYYSYYQIGLAMMSRQDPWEKTEEVFLLANQYDKSRAEPLYHVAFHYRMVDNYEKAYYFAKMGCEIKNPPLEKLFVSQDMYTWKLPDELAVDSYKLGKYQEAYLVWNDLITKKLVPKGSINRVTDNINFCLDFISKKNCLLYVTTFNSMYHNIIDTLDKIYNIYIVSDKTTSGKYITVNPADISLLSEVSFDVVYLLNNLNFFSANSIACEKIILIQEDDYFKIISKNGTTIEITNPVYLNKMLAKISKIICQDKVIKSLCKNYQFDEQNIVRYTNVPGFVDECAYKYNISKEFTPDNFFIGFEIVDPVYITTAKDTQTELSKNLMEKYYIDVYKSFPGYTELSYYLAAHYFNTQNTQKTEDLISHTQSQSPSIFNVLEAKILYTKKKYQESYNLANTVCLSNNLSPKYRIEAEQVRDTNIEFIKQSFLTYNTKKIKQLQNTSTKSNVLFTITSCKRYDLFEKTLNSFINCCSDISLIDKWLCIDDNSDDIDRKKMIVNYPFMEFIFKDQKQKGHFKSMNIIRDYAIKNSFKYILHSEDDFHYIQKRNYIAESICVLESDPNFGQVLFNRNYCEIEPYKQPIYGGILKIVGKSRILIHEHYDPITCANEHKAFLKRHQDKSNCEYWQHFSFRPSVLKVSMLDKVGCYCNTPHFEQAYAKDYIACGYKSVFLDTFSCIHIGKKTWERNIANSYEMNDSMQFKIKDKNIPIYFITKRDNDTNNWTKIKNQLYGSDYYVIKHELRNITNLTDYEKQIFAGNSFNYVRPLLNLFMTYIDIFRLSKEDHIIIFNNTSDLQLTDKFLRHVETCVKKINNYDIVIFDTLSTDSETSHYAEIDKKKCGNNFIISRKLINEILDVVSHGNIKLCCLWDLLSSSNAIRFICDMFTANYPDQLNIKYFEDYPGYTFYSQLDSYDHDIEHVSDKSILDIKLMCDKNPDALGFNTLGYIKNKVCEEKALIYLIGTTNSVHGFYKKNHSEDGLNNVASSIVIE